MVLKPSITLAVSCLQRSYKSKPRYFNFRSVFFSFTSKFLAGFWTSYTVFWTRTEPPPRLAPIGPIIMRPGPLLPRPTELLLIRPEAPPCMGEKVAAPAFYVWKKFFLVWGVYAPPYAKELCLA